MKRLGIDIGSTTVKVAVIDEEHNILFSEYKRHFANIKETLKELVEHASKELGNVEVAPTITGSGGLALAQVIGIPFEQEVVCVSEALTDYAPQTDVAIELGQDHLFYKRCGTAYERCMCRRYRFLYRPDGIPAPDRRFRTEYIREGL